MLRVPRIFKLHFGLLQQLLVIPSVRVCVVTSWVLGNIHANAHVGFEITSNYASVYGNR